jgi:hypothetical protein
MCAVLMLIAVSAHAQGKMRKADGGLITTLNAIAIGVDKAMDTEGSRINFSRWDAPIGFIDASKGQYEQQKREVVSLHNLISKIKSSGMVSSLHMFFIYRTYRDVRGILTDFERDAHEYQQDSYLAGDLTSIETELFGWEEKLNVFIIKSIIEDSSDLEKCDGKNYVN